MVLHCVLGDGETNNKVGLVEEETVGGVSFIFVDIRDILFPAGKPATQATRHIPLEILVLL